MSLISLYGAPLAQRVSYLALQSSLFGPMVQVIMIILSLTALTICYLAHTLTIAEPIWLVLQNLSKTLICIITWYIGDVKMHFHS